MPKIWSRFDALATIRKQPASVWWSMIVVGLAMTAIFDARRPGGLRSMLALGVLLMATVGFAWMTVDGLVGWLRPSSKCPPSKVPDRAKQAHPLWDWWLDG